MSKKKNKSTFREIKKIDKDRFAKFEPGGKVFAPDLEISEDTQEALQRFWNNLLQKTD